jgi:Transposase DNA-binding
MRDALLATPSWAVTACAAAALGDRRRPQRLGQLAPARAQRPGAALPEACGSGAMLTAACRFFSNGDMAPADIVQRHSEATDRRLHAVPLVWAVQETTEANWPHWRAPAG